MKNGVLCAILLGVGSAVAAQPIWRCGTDGRVFSDRPCADGQPHVAADRRSDDEVQAAQSVALRQQRLADTLARERQVRAQVAPGSGLAGIGPLAADRVVRQQVASRRPEARRPSAAGTSKAAARASRRAQG